MGSKYSDSRKFTMDNETLSLVVEAYTEAKVILTIYKDLVQEMVDLLKNKTVLSPKDLTAITEKMIFEN